MNTLYRLHTALLNANGNTSNRGVFIQLRKTLQDRWSSTLEFLQKCYAFGDDVQALEESLRTESQEYWVESINDMSSMADSLLARCEKIRTGSESVLSDFRLHVPKFTGDLKHGKKLTPPSIPIPNGTPQGLYLDFIAPF